MATGILIGGETGTGKSTSMETLDPASTALINVSNKPLPFKGWKSKFTPLNKEGKGNLVITDRSENIVKTLNYFSSERPEIKTVVIDDFQYVSSFEFMRRSSEVGYTKFTDIAKHLFDVVTSIPKLREDLIVIVMNHLDIDRSEFGESKAKVKTIGKMVDQYIALEGLFTVVLYTDVDPENTDMRFGFVTQNNGSNTVKSPRGMFEDFRIPNDLAYVVQRVNEFNN